MMISLFVRGSLRHALIAANSSAISNANSRSVPAEQRRSIRHGFTLVELLVVIAIIGVLVALLLPAVQAAREAARRAQCISQIKQVSLAMINYESAFGHFPEGTRTHLQSTFDESAPYGERRLGNLKPGAPAGGNECKNGPAWTILILPYLEQQALYDRFDLNAVFPTLYDSCTTSTNHARDGSLGVMTPLGIWQCPSDSLSAPDSLYNNYHTCIGGGDWEAPDPTNPELGFEGSSFMGTPKYRIFNNGITGYDKKTTFGQIEDGSSNTILVGENRLHFLDCSHGFGCGRYQGWSTTFQISKGFGIPNNASAASRPINFDPNPGSGDQVVWNSPGYRATTFGSHHPGGAHFAFADGSATLVSEDVDELLYWSLGRMADGLTLDGSIR